MTFSGCRSFPTIDLQERCVNLPEFNKCRCHKYNLIDDERVSDSYDEPIEYCERLVGFPPESWEEIKVWLGEVKLWKSKKKK